MKSLKRYHDGQLIWAAKRYCTGKRHINPALIEGVWEYYQVRGYMTKGQREAIEKFINKYKVCVQDWLNDDFGR